jgi:hypothetical protein
LDKQEVERVKDQTAQPMLKQNKDVSLLQPLAVEPVAELDHLEELVLQQLEKQTAPLAQHLLHNLAKIFYL